MSSEENDGTNPLAMISTQDLASELGRRAAADSELSPPCPWCQGERVATQLCDYPLRLTPFITCDAPICPECAMRDEHLYHIKGRGEVAGFHMSDTDYCPEHAKPFLRRQRAEESKWKP